ncbi:MAG: protein-ADP-ribose hydrolase [Ruminococcaceae bacterium]|nr:protein-ADP-ribose hydrolase [Oscillospiraceae bacterium]
MTQKERLLWLINYLLSEDERYRNIALPTDSREQFNLYRSLVNVRMPEPISEEYLKLEDEYLKGETAAKGIVTLDELDVVCDGIYLWQGDITRLAADAIVNAANSQMLGCFAPCHACIDNCIHTYAGVRLRLKCSEIMAKQGFAEPTGKAKITSAYNLPCKFVIHTVGPIVQHLSTSDRLKLESCYRECLKAADENSLDSIAFCCISTGEFHFPNDEAARIAVKTVRDYKVQTGSKIKVVFNVFKDLDKAIYEKILTKLKDD